PRHPPRSPLFPYTTLFRSVQCPDERANPRIRLADRAPRPELVFDQRAAELDAVVLVLIGAVAAMFGEVARRCRATRSSRSSPATDRKSTRLNSSHLGISYA